MGCYHKGSSMLTNDFLPSADGRRQTTTRRRLLHMAATLSATAPLAALTAGGTSSPVFRRKCREGKWKPKRVLSGLHEPRGETIGLALDRGIECLD